MVTVTGLKNHPGFWLEDSAAAAFDAYEDAHGILELNSAGRYEHEQQELIDRWHAGGKWNRPPYLYRPAEPADQSPHVRGGGRAVDVEDYRKFREHSEDFGFVWFGESDPVHFDFRGWNGKPATVKKVEEDEMAATYINIQGKAGVRKGGCYAIMRDNSGVLFARFVEPKMLDGVPTIPDSEFAGWNSTMPIV